MNRRHCLILSLCLLITTHAWAETRVMIDQPSIPPHDSNAPPSPVIEGMLLSCLGNTKNIAVVERQELARASDEKSLSALSKASLSAHYLAADLVITSSVTSVGNRWLVVLQANLITTTQMIAAYGEYIPMEYNQDTFCKKVVTPFAGKLAVAHITELKAKPDEAPQLSTWLMNGIAQYKSGNYTAAFPPLLKVIEANPDHPEARYWLTLAYEKAGMHDLAVEEARECVERFPYPSKCNEFIPSLVEQKP